MKPTFRSVNVEEDAYDILVAFCKNNYSCPLSRVASEAIGEFIKNKVKP